MDKSMEQGRGDESRARAPPTSTVVELLHASFVVFLVSDASYMKLSAMTFEAHAQKV